MDKKIIIILVFILILVIIIVGYFFFFPVKNVYHIGIISGTDFFEGTDQGFRDKMSELGYREGENIVYDIKKVNNDLAAANKIVQKFINNKVDLIFAFPTNVATLAKDLAKDTSIPIVFGDATIEGSGLVKNINYPGDNITGVRQATIEITLKRFELMHQLAPNAKKYLIFYQSNLTIIPNQLRELLSLAEKSGVQLILKPVDSTADIDFYLKAQDKMPSLDFDAILTIIEPVAVIPASSKILSEFADSHNIPFGGAPMFSANAKNLFGVSIDNVLAGKDAALITDKILKGTFAGSIPVVTAESYIQVNLKIAEKLGLTIDDNVLSQANKVIR